MDVLTQTKKYKKYRLSKWKFPTTIQKGKGGLSIGSTKAKSALEGRLHRSVDNMKPMHTKNEWVYGEELVQNKEQTQ